MWPTRSCGWRTTSPIPIGPGPPVSINGHLILIVEFGGWRIRVSLVNSIFHFKLKNAKCKIDSIFHFSLHSWKCKMGNWFNIPFSILLLKIKNAKLTQNSIFNLMFSKQKWKIELFKIPCSIWCYYFLVFLFIDKDNMIPSNVSLKFPAPPFPFFCKGGGCSC